MNMCVCITKLKHTYILSNEITAHMLKMKECENAHVDDDESFHGYALQYICIVTHCMQFQNKTQCIQSKASAFIAMHYISNP